MGTEDELKEYRDALVDLLAVCDAMYSLLGQSAFGVICTWDLSAMERARFLVGTKQ